MRQKTERHQGAAERTIKGTDLGIRKTPGTTLTNEAIGETIYTPPEGESLLRDKLKNWETFLHDDEEIDPLIKMAIGHYQFEAIHPFPDGNGLELIVSDSHFNEGIVFKSGR